MRILKRRSLQECDRGQNTVVESGEEVIGIVLMIGRVLLFGAPLVAAADGLDGAWTRVGQVSG